MEKHIGIQRQNELKSQLPTKNWVKKQVSFDKCYAEHFDKLSITPVEVLRTGF